MKILKIFANEKFKNVRLNEHFNIILATIQDKENKKDTHNLGKTSLTHIINFLLLDKFDKNKGLLSNPIFLGRIFYLELRLNNGQTLVIKRAVDFPTKISFKLSDIGLKDFNPPTEWDDEDLPFEKAKEKLDFYLSFDALSNWKFRKSITYFLRTQQDYLDVYQLGKFQKGKDVDWKPYVFELLSFDGELITRKINIEKEISDLEKRIRILIQEANINAGEKDKLLGFLDIKKQEKQEAEMTIDKFNFYFEDNLSTKVIIEDIDYRIQVLNNEKYRICYEINKTEDSLRESDHNIDMKKLKKLYNEVDLFFPEQLQKQYEDLEKFAIAISTERRKYLRDNLVDLQIELASVNTELINLEKDKSEKLSFLTEKDTYAKFKFYQKKLAELDVEIALLSQKLRLIDKTTTIEEEINKRQETINIIIAEIKNMLTLRKHAEINKIFDDILKEIVNQHAIISIKQNKYGNVEFSADYIDVDFMKKTSESEGTSYKKLLCMAFDLSLLIYYSKNSFFRFAYHDGIIEGLDDRIKVRLLNKIKNICQEYNIQHIISLIDSDIPVQNDGLHYQFEENEICLELHDKDDDGKLFLQSF